MKQRVDGWYSPNNLGFGKNIQPNLRLTKKMISEMKKNEFAIAGVLYLSKPFDMVDPQILLNELKYYPSGRQSM